MNEHPAIRKLLLSRLENTLSAGEEQKIESHLRACSSCRRYFEALGAALGPAKQPPVPILTPDPYLPARIRALAGQEPGVRGAVRPIYRWVLRSAAFAVAVAFGIYIGETLSTQPATLTDQRVISEFSQSLDVGGLGDRLQTVALTSEVSQ